MERKQKYLFKIIWSRTSIGIAVNQIYDNSYDIPLTTFYFWPKEDGWQLLKIELDSKPWILENSKIIILNGYARLIDYWIQNINYNINFLEFSKKNTDLSIEILAINSLE